MLAILLSFAARAFESEPQPIAFEDAAIPLFAGQKWASDWLPSGSAVQVQLTVVPDLRARVVASGDATLGWPSALELGVAGSSGELGLSGTYEVDTMARVDVFGLSIEVPLDARIFHVDAASEFEPFLLGEESATASVADTQEIPYETDLASGVTLSAVLTVGTDVDVTLSDGKVYVDDDRAIEVEGATAPVEADGGATQQASASWTGRIEDAAEVSFDAEVDVCFLILGCIGVDPYTQMDDIEGESFWHSFGTADVAFPLPILDVARSSDLGTSRVGESADVFVRVSNRGDLALEVSPSIEGAGLTVLTPLLVVEPGRSGDIAIGVAPTSSGDVAGVLTLASNDPLLPEVRIDLAGTALAPESLPPEGLDPTDDLAPTKSGGCGCATTPIVPSSWVLVGLVGFVLRRRRA